MRKYTVVALLISVMLISLISGCSKTGKVSSTDNSCPPNKKVGEIKSGNTPVEANADSLEKQKVFEAVMKDYLATVKAMLMKNKGILDVRNIKEATPLHVAVKLGNMDIVKFLISEGADVNALNYKKRTPLHVAATHDQPEAAKYLVDHGADLNARSDILSVPLHDAVVTNNLRTVKILVEKGANLNAMSKKGMTPLTAALMRNHKEIADYLLSKGAQYDKNAADPKTKSLVTNEIFCCENL